MELQKNKKRKLKELLFSVSSESEKEKMSALEIAKIGDDLEDFSEGLTKQIATVNESMSALSTMVDKVKNSSFKSSERFSEDVKSLVEALTSKLEEVKKVSDQSEYQKLTVPLYKSMINAISGVNKSIVDKPTPVWRWPQYASVSVRNKNFANINPAVDGFDIGSYDNIILTYTGDNITTVTYYVSGAVTAELTLTYSGSNLVQVQRTQ